MSKRIQESRGKYGEKKERVNLGLTLTAQQLLDQQAAQLGVSRSELIERFARGLVSPSPELRSLGGSFAN